MAGFVRTVLHCFLAVAGVAALAVDATSLAQSSGWGEPIAAPAKPEAPPPAPPEPRASPAPEPEAPSSAEPNPDWSDPPPTEYEERSPQNPDWVEETEPPPVGKMPRLRQHQQHAFVDRRKGLWPCGLASFTSPQGETYRPPIETPPIQIPLKPL